MNSFLSNTNLVEGLLHLHPIRSVVVPCVCRAGHPFPSSPDCAYCEGYGKILYGIAEVEVI